MFQWNDWQHWWFGTCWIKWQHNLTVCTKRQSDAVHSVVLVHFTHYFVCQKRKWFVRTCVYMCVCVLPIISDYVLPTYIYHSRTKIFWDLRIYFYLYAFPERTLPARPARWAAEAWDTGTTTRESVWVSGLNHRSFTNPQSTTARKLVNILSSILKPVKN